MDVADAILTYFSAAIPQSIALYDAYHGRLGLKSIDIVGAVIRTAVTGTFCLWIPTTKYITAASLSYIWLL